MAKRAKQASKRTRVAPGAVTVECGSETYRLRVGDAVGVTAEYGDPAELTVEGETYLATIHETSDGKRISLLESGYIIQGAYVPCKFATMADEDFEPVADADDASNDDGDEPDDEDDDDAGDDDSDTDDSEDDDEGEDEDEDDSEDEDSGDPSEELDDDDGGDDDEDD